MTPDRATPVRTLLGAGGFEASILCLRSLLEYSADDLRLVVHEDGTLSDEHMGQLREIEPRVEVIQRKAADEKVLSLLARHPRCHAFRRSEIMALKLFDLLAFADGWASYCDSDFLFLRRYTGLFLPPASGRPTFMTDSTHAYAIRPWGVQPFGAVRLLGRLNAGLTVAPVSLLDLDFLEWLLTKLSANPVFHRRRYWTEQTCWAALAAHGGGADLLDPHQVVMATRHMRGFRPEAIALHCVSTFRHHLMTFRHRQQGKDAAPIAICRKPARTLSSFGMAWSDLRRRVAPPR